VGCAFWFIWGEELGMTGDKGGWGVWGRGAEWGRGKGGERGSGGGEESMDGGWKMEERIRRIEYS